MYKKSIILASCVAVATGAWYAGAAKVDVTHFVPQKAQGIARSGSPAGAVDQISGSGSARALSAYFDAPDNGTLVAYEKNRRSKKVHSTSTLLVSVKAMHCERL